MRHFGAFTIRIDSKRHLVYELLEDNRTVTTWTCDHTAMISRRLLFLPHLQCDIITESGNCHRRSIVLFCDKWRENN